jgi:hypothetical protein
MKAYSLLLAVGMGIGMAGCGKVDVPAIQKKAEKICGAPPDIAKIMELPNGCAWIPQYWTCADPKRILEVAENGTDHWCRRVQP